MSVRYSQITGTVNSSKMRSGVFKKLQQQSNKPAGEFTIRDSQVSMGEVGHYMVSIGKVTFR